MRKTNKEIQLNNIIKRNISEISSELTEEKWIGADCNGKNGNDGCPKGSFCSGMPTRKAGTCQSSGMVSNTGGKGKGRKRRSHKFNDRLPYSKDASKNIVKSLKEELLTERKWCWWRSNMQDQGGNKCEKSRNLDFSNEDCQTRARCLGPNGDNVVRPNNDGIKARDIKVRDIKASDIKTYGKKLRRAKEASKHITMKESDLINIIRRQINESSLLTEGKKCDNSGGCDAGSTCTSVGRGAQGYCCDAEEKSSRDSWRNCAGGGMLAPGGPGKTRGGKSTTSKPGGKDRDYSSTEVSESELINIIKRTINESSLLVEAEGCGSARDNKFCSDATSGRGTCKGNGGECYIPEGGMLAPGGPGKTRGEGGAKSPTTIRGGWSNMSNIISAAERKGKLGDNTAFSVLNSISKLPIGPDDTPDTGRARCGEINDFGGDRFCFTPDLEGWKITIWI